MGNAALQMDPHTRDSDKRVESWKEIATHLRRSVRTVKRWEKVEGLPVHRHAHSKAASVYAYRSELEAWWVTRQPRLDGENNLPVGETLRAAFLRRVPCLATASFLIILCYIASRLMLR